MAWGDPPTTPPHAVGAARPPWRVTAAGGWRVGVLARRKAPGRIWHSLGFADKDPAEVGRGMVEPSLDVGNHRSPIVRRVWERIGRLGNVINDSNRRRGRVVIVRRRGPWRVPRIGRESERAKPGRLVGRGRRALPGSVGGVVGPLTPTPQ